MLFSKNAIQTFTRLANNKSFLLSELGKPEQHEAFRVEAFRVRVKCQGGRQTGKFYSDPNIHYARLSKTPAR